MSGYVLVDGGRKECVESDAAVCIRSYNYSLQSFIRRNRSPIINSASSSSSSTSSSKADGGSAVSFFSICYFNLVTSSHSLCLVIYFSFSARTASFFRRRNLRVFNFERTQLQTELQT